MIDFDALVLTPLVEKIFGESVLYAPALVGASSFAIQGVYDAEYKEVDPAGEMGVTTYMPVLGVRSKAFVDLAQPLPLQGDKLTIVRTGEKYIVKEVQPDSHGHLLLKLNFSS